MRGAGILKWPFQGEPYSSCFFVVFRAASSICISFLYIKLGGLPGAGKVHLKCSYEKQSQLRQSAAKTSSHVHVEPSALVWQIIENILVETQSRPAWVISTCCNCFAKHQKLFFSVYSFGKDASWVFIAKLVMFHLPCTRNLFQFSCNTAEFWKTPEPACLCLFKGF